MALPWYAFYPGDYARDTADLTMLEHGAYRLLLDFYYSNSEKNLNFLSEKYTSSYVICKANSAEEKKAVRKILHKFFQNEGGFFRHLRADKEIAKQLEKHSKATQKAADAAKARWEKDRK